VPTVRVFDSSPVYVAGLVAVLGRHGVSAAAGGCSSHADASIVNPAVVAGTGLAAFVAATTCRCCHPGSGRCCGTSPTA
jgi:hypothetical protein